MSCSLRIYVLVQALAMTHKSVKSLQLVEESKLIENGVVTVRGQVWSENWFGFVSLKLVCVNVQVELMTWKVAITQALVENRTYELGVQSRSFYHSATETDKNLT